MQPLILSALLLAAASASAVNLGRISYFTGAAGVCTGSPQVVVPIGDAAVCTQVSESSSFNFACAGSPAKAVEFGASATCAASGTDVLFSACSPAGSTYNKQYSCFDYPNNQVIKVTLSSACTGSATKVADMIFLADGNCHRFGDFQAGFAGGSYYVQVTKNDLVFSLYSDFECKVLAQAIGSEMSTCKAVENNPFTSAPTKAPTKVPTKAPTAPTVVTLAPTNAPTTPTVVTLAPTLAPTPPTSAPTKAPTNTPTKTPTDTPTTTPTNAPTKTPTNTPTKTPTDTPTKSPTKSPTNTPTKTPTNTPTNTPTDSPTASPTDTPTKTPSHTPTTAPTDTPTASPLPTLPPSPEVDERRLQGTSQISFKAEPLVPGTTIQDTPPAPTSAPAAPPKGSSANTITAQSVSVLVIVMVSMVLTMV